MHSPSSSNPLTPSSPLRIAAQTSLHMTASQCDNVRTLMVALTKQSELVQLTEMYASNLHSSPVSPLPRPMSLPLEHATGDQEEIRRSEIDRKRMTWSVGGSPTSPRNHQWNGSYSSIANAGSPTMRVMKRREKRRSDLSALMGVSVSAGGSPRRSPTWSPILETKTGEEEPFGPSALALRRKRQSQGSSRCCLVRHM